MSPLAVAVSERPMLFSGAMVRAILEGRKTQTRRVVQPLPSWRVHSVCDPSGAADDWAVWFHFPDTDRVGHMRYCPYGKPGDRLWVRETFATAGGNRILYCATDDVNELRKKKPAIHMLRSYSRLTLEITKVRVERVQEISQEDCIAEGISKLFATDCLGIPEFRRLWDSINSKRGYGWEKNPWVWVIEFKRGNP